MSISSYTTVTMLDSRPSPITISVPRSTDITNRIITFKDLFGSASNSTIILVTQSGDTFEDGTFSTIMSNAYQTVNLYAGQPGKWLNIGATGGGGDSAGLTTVSNNLTTVSNTVAAGRFPFVSTNTLSTNQINSSNICNAGWISNNGVFSNITAGAFFQATSNTGTLGVGGILTAASNITQTGGTTVLAGLSVTTISTNFIVASNISVASMSTTYGFFSTISTGSVFGRFIGDGSSLTNLPIARISSTLSTLAFFTSSISTANITSPQGYISSLVVDSLAFSFSNSFIVMGDIITTSVSTIQTFTSSLTTNNLRVGTVSSLSYISFPGLQQGYAQTAIAEQSTGTGLQELLVFRGSSASDRIRMQTTGSIVFEPGVSARVFPSVLSNITPAMIINSSSNVGIGTAAPGVALDVVGAGRFTAVSTNTLSTNQVNSSNICNAGFLSNNGVFSNITAGAFFQNTSNTGTLGLGGILTTVSNITQTGGTTTLAGLSVNTISTNQVNSSNICNAGFLSNNGVFSNITAGAFFQNTSNTGTLGLGGILTTVSNITQTGGTTTLAGLSVNTISTNQVNSSNICNAGFLSNNGVFSNLTAGAFFQNTSNTGTLGVAGILTAASNITQTGGTTVLAGLSVTTISTNTINANMGRFTGISTTTISTNTLTVGGTLYGRLPISTNNTTLTNPASIIIKTPNTSYFYEDYTNLTNYITISNYGAQNGDFINIVNTGNSGTPATFQVLDGSTGASTIIRYIYPGHAGVVAYSGSQWWPL